MSYSDFPADEVQDIKFKKDEEERLVNHLCKEIDAAFSDRAGLEQKWKLWAQQANSRRKRPDARTRDAQIDMPLTRERMIQVGARLINPIIQQEAVYTSVPRTPGLKKESDDVEKILDEKVDKIDMQLFMSDYIEQFCTFSCAVAKTPYIVQTADYKRWEKVDLEEYEAYKEGGLKTRRVPMDNDEVYYYIEVDGSYEVKRGTEFLTVPIEDFVFPYCSESVEKAEWVAHRLWLTKPEVEDQIRQGIFKEKSGDAKTIDLLGKPASQRERLLRIGADKEGGESPGKQYELFETYIRWSVDGKEKPREIIVVLDRKSKTLVRAVENFYQSHCRPFVTHAYRPVLGSIYGIPMTFDLEPLHVAYSASFNQRLDAASKANEVAVFVPPGSKLLKDADQDGFRGGVYESMGTKDETWSFSVSEPFTQLPNMESIFEQRADKLVSVNEYSFGNEQISRPTASGQIQLIEEGKQPLYVKLEQFRKTLAKLALHLLSRERQFNPEGIAVWTTVTDENGEDAPQREVIEWPKGAIEEYAIVQISVTSAQMSKSIRKQEITALAEKIPQIYQTYMQMAQTAANPQDPSALFAVKLLNGYQTVIDTMLTEFEVADKGKLNPDLIQEAQVVQQIQQAMQQMQQQIQSMGAQMQSLQAQNQQLQAVASGPGMGRPPGPASPMQRPPSGPMPPQGPMPA